MIAIQNQSDHLKQLLSCQNDQLNVHKRELRVTSLKMHKDEAMMVKMKEDKLVLKRRIKEQAEEHVGPQRT